MAVEDNDFESLVKEIQIMNGCRSKYIVQFYGSYFKDQHLWVCACTVAKCLSACPLSRTPISLTFPPPPPLSSPPPLGKDCD